MKTTTTIPSAYAENDTLADVYLSGFNYGRGLACHNVPTLGAKFPNIREVHEASSDDPRITVDEENIREVHEATCFGTRLRQQQQAMVGRHYSRQYEAISDGIFRLGEGTDAGGPSSGEAWDAFDAGMSDAIQADIATYTDADYGIGSDE
jgi:hypothetical protein